MEEEQHTLTFPEPYGAWNLSAEVLGEIADLFKRPAKDFGEVLGWIGGWRNGWQNLDRSIYYRARDPSRSSSVEGYSAEMNVHQQPQVTHDSDTAP